MIKHSPNRPIRMMVGLFTLIIPALIVIVGQFYASTALAAVALAPQAGELTLTAPAGQTSDVTSGAQSVVYVYTLANTQAVTYTVQLVAPTPPLGYSVAVQPSSAFTLTPSSSTSVTMTVTIPNTAANGTILTSTLTATETTTSTITVSQSAVTTIVNNAVSLDVTGNTTDQSVLAGSTATYAYTIKNTSSVAETFNIAVAESQSGWTSSVAPTTLTLAAGASGVVTTTVTVPSGATNGQTSTSTVTATANSDSTKSDTATNITTASVAATSTPTNTPVATPTNTPDPNLYADALEPNDSFSAPTELVANAADVCSLTFWPLGDKDYYYFNTVVGQEYTILAEVKTGGIDTYMTVYDPSGDVIATNDDRESGDRSSEITFIAGTANTHFVKVENLDGSDPANKTYCIELDSVTPTETPTPSMTPTPSETPEPSSTPEPTATATVPGDGCEPNNEFGRACLIESNKKYSSIDFQNPYGNGPDKDWYRVWVKRGLTYTCLTEDLSGFNDTNMTLYDKNNRWLGSNDDRAVGDFGSEVTYRTTYDGYLYVLVEPFNTPDSGQGSEYTYSLTCKSIAPTATPEPTNTPEPTATSAATNTPKPTNTPAATNTAVATNTPASTNTPAATNTKAATATPTLTKAPAATSTPAPTNTPKPTNTPRATNVPKATNTPRPTKTPAPTNTAAPTRTRRPAATTSSGSVTVRRTNTPVPTATQAATETPTETLEPTVEPTETLIPTATATPRPVVDIAPLPTATPEIEVAQTTTLNVILYYDENDNRQPEITEGIVDMVVVVYDNTTGDLLSFGYTNEGGAVRFRDLPLDGPVRISVPYLGFSQVVSGQSTIVQLRIPPQQLPGGVP